MAADVASSASNSAQNADYAVSVPSGTTDGDLLICLAASDFSTAAANPIPTGFTALTTSDYDGGTDTVHALLGYRLASSEPASYTFAGAGNTSDNVGWLLRVTGHDGIPTITETAPTSFTGGTGAVTSPSITPAGPRDLLLCFAVGDGANGGSGGSMTWSYPSGMTAVGQLQSTIWTNAAVAKQLLTSSAATGTKSWSASPSHDVGACLTLAVRSRASGAPANVMHHPMRIWRP